MNGKQQPDAPASRWYRLAEEDLSGARALLERDDVAPRIACFLSQQAAEKALKAGLIAVDQPFPRIHSLTRLADSYPTAVRPVVDEDDLDVLDPWVVDGRYAADLPDVSSVEADAIVSLAERVVEAVRPLIDERQGR